MSALTNGLTPHEVQRQERRGWNYLFIAPVEAHLLTELFHSPPRPGRGVQGPARGLLAPGVDAFHALCWRGCLTRKFGNAGAIKKSGWRKEAKFTEFGGDYPRRAAPSPSILTAAYATDWTLCAPHQMETKLTFCEYTMGECSTSNKDRT